ncbi:nitroreductase family protein [Streptomyces sp. NPDC048172]|uniref:nitroreductase family protein n=1 Tax=Streptomyces sp. NPDC048172 TaxID=3365505 RepID=UPI00371A7BF9
MTGHVHAYLDAVLRRASVPMEGEVFRPDWADGPRSHKVYEGLPAYPLPPGDASPASPLTALSGMLHDSYAWRSRRLRITADPGQGGRERYGGAAWGRGSAAGGGLYPCEIYWVTGVTGAGHADGGGVLPGVYHYDQPGHAVRRLITGDVSARVSRALGFDTQTGPDQFLLVTVRFWQNAFKYAEFSYHCVTMDLGCLLGTWQTWAAAHDVPLSPAALWFDELDLNRLLGLDPADESVLAVVPLPWSEPDTRRRVAPTSPGPDPGLQADTPVAERSRAVRHFPQAQSAHLAAVEAPPHLPPAPSPRLSPTSPTDTAPLPLPPPAPPRRDLSASLATRRSSFGLLSAETPLAAEELAALLRAATETPHLRTDVRPGTGKASGTPPLTGVAVFVNHVTDVPPGVYAYEPEAHALTPIPGPGPHPFLQDVYTLNNYNLEQAATVLVARARPHAVLDATGPRGYRLLNAEIGALAQSVYLTATAHGLSCGAALGFDYEKMANRLGKGPENDTWPLLLLMTGHERPTQAEFDARLT